MVRCRAGWKRTCELAAGDRLVSHTRAAVPVESVRLTPTDATVYNLRVSQDHTYFVGRADWGFSIWAHNAYTIVEIEVDGKRLFAFQAEDGKLGAIHGSSYDEMVELADQNGISLAPFAQNRTLIPRQGHLTFEPGAKLDADETAVANAFDKATPFL